MKVVLFCGGYGLRLRGYREAVPKPMVRIGARPILWHIMKYYAHFGHTEFILCLGWKANVIKRFFLEYNESLSNDFVLLRNGQGVELLSTDVHDWKITFVDTGVSTIIGQRLKAIQPYVEGERTFLANYADCLTDLSLPDLIGLHHRQQAVATFVSIRPSHSFHAVAADGEGHVRGIQSITEADVWMNGGHFVFDHQIFDYIGEGEELVEAPFGRLIAQQRLITLRYRGFWGCMDTYKEKRVLDEMCARGTAPWQVWRRPKRRETPVYTPTLTFDAAMPVTV